MKRIVFALAATFVFISCNDSDQSADGKNSGADSAAIKDSLAKVAAAGVNNTAPAEPVIDSANLTTVEWLGGQDRDFGKMKEGENLEVTFKFKNTGSKPLIISRVWAQCGCTVPETPQKPYAPGETGEIKASFNSTGKPGTNTKEVYMTANTNPGTSVLVFHVNVDAKK
jgi:hypothetical protein